VAFHAKNPMPITLWYNPKCGTCRRVREAIEAKGYTPQLVDYLKTSPSMDEIDQACKKAGIEPSRLARQKEPIYPSIAARCRTRQDWLRALHENPILIERPVVIWGERAIIARPAERVEEIFN
jgi:arsenate reductase